MKLQFKIQQYQTDAVDSVVRIFSGQPSQGLLSYKIDKGRIYVEDKGQRMEIKTLEFYEDNSEGYKNNELKLNDIELLANIHQIQSENKIHQSNTIVKNLGRCQLDVEMETGTGKTYVYIKTMFELNKIYGWTKYIVVVPSLAIREGVKKSFDITAEHFMELYGKKARYFVYDSNNLNQIDIFSQSSDISVMIINIQAFNTSMKEGASNKAARIIYDKRDEFNSRRPIDVIAANNPILILDEPQKMGGNATQTALKRFNPLFTLNYSATHKESHNPVYVLDALDAYNQKLVKKIEVVGFELKNLRGTNSYIYLSDIILAKDEPPKARLEFEIKGANSIKRMTKTLSAGDDLYSLSGGLNQYKGFKISDINVGMTDDAKSNIVFTNGVTLFVKEYVGNITAEHKARIQIRETIRAHFRKESSLFPLGIKCLSLFFLDEVANYRKYDDDGNQVLGPYGKIFEEEYINEMNENKNLFDDDYTSYLDKISSTQTHAGYFSIDRHGRSVNSELKRGTDISDDISAYDLILKNKERLLSLDEPVRFIFSHSALREGWDNPNVFQICSLRQSNGITQKRQEVGRGLRLCVNDSGIRQDVDMLSSDVHNINKLTVIASEGYATFVGGLQSEIRDDLYDRPKKVDVNLFANKVVSLANGETHTITSDEANAINIFVAMSCGYITYKGELTPAFHEAVENNTLKPLPDDLAPYTEHVYKLMQSIFDPKVLDNMIEDASKQTTPPNKLNDNFNKKEFQDLWKRINHKFAYVVNFDSDELIEKAVAAINKELNVTTLSYVVTHGVQADNLTHEDIRGGNMMRQENVQQARLKTDVVSHVKYDLLGKIASGTKLTRKTIASILQQIKPEKFNMYKQNPEEFIQKTTRIINEQKATIIVEHIEYNIVEGEYDSSIFTMEKHTSMDKAYEGHKSIVDYVFTDGTAIQSIERQFVENLDKADEVVVYAKLPKGFHIPTPVGNYSPDWAIAFQEGKVKHIYFVAETKGSMSTLELREIERCKIDCAKKLFEKLSSENVKYDQVDSYDTLLNIVQPIATPI